MKSLQNIKEELQQGIEKLPDHKIPEVLQFVNFLIYSQERFFPQDAEKKEEIGNDPLADFIGAIEVGSLTQNIDEELYGK